MSTIKWTIEAKAIKTENGILGIRFFLASDDVWYPIETAPEDLLEEIGRRLMGETNA